MFPGRGYRFRTIDTPNSFAVEDEVTSPRHRGEAVSRRYSGIASPHTAFRSDRCVGKVLVGLSEAHHGRVHVDLALREEVGDGIAR
jgi:hypothetical protein